MNCKTARMLVDLVGPHSGELDAAEARDFQQHQERCPECSDYAQRELHMDKHLGRAMRSVAVPSGVRDRLLARLHQERKVLQRGLLIRTSAAAAAVLILAVGGYFSIQAVNSYQVVFNPSEDGQPSYVPDVPLDDSRQPERVEQWFLDNHQIHLRLPKQLAEQWDFGYLKTTSLTKRDGVNIPTLEFEKDGSKVTVYLLHRDQFDRNRLPDLGQQQARDHVLLGDPKAEDYIALVVVHEGGRGDFEKPPKRLIA